MTAPDPLVLCIEDEPDLLEDLQLELGEAGFSVAGAKDGRAGMDAIARERPQLVICDIQLPGFSGLDLLRKAGELAGPGTGPAYIMLSAFNDAQVREEATALGATHFLVKPVDYAELIVLVESVLAPLRTAP